MKSSALFLMAAFLLLSQPGCTTRSDEEHTPRTDSVPRAPGLSHFYIVLDAETFDAIKQSEWFSGQFAAVDTGLPEFDMPAPESDRLYVRGRETYLELLGPENRFKEPVGKVGIALGADAPEDLDDLERRWKGLPDGDVLRTRVHWTKSEPHVPWYDVVQHAATSSNSHVVIWGTTYLPEFIPWLHPGSSGTSRKEYLAPRYKRERVLRDVSGLVVAVPPDLRKQLARQLEAVGFSREDSAQGVTFTGSGWHLVLDDQPGVAYGLVSVRMEINRDAIPADSRRRFGKSVLEMGASGEALWQMR